MIVGLSSIAIAELAIALEIPTNKAVEEMGIKDFDQLHNYFKNINSLVDLQLTMVRWFCFNFQNTIVCKNI